MKDTNSEMMNSQNTPSTHSQNYQRNLMVNVRRPEIIKSVLAVCPDDLDQKSRLEWLQEKRCVGVWAQCSACEQYRFLADVHDPCALPRGKWTCADYPSLSCDVPKEEPSALEEEHFIQDAYNAGSVVRAKLDDCPWWPAMIDDDPNIETFYWLDGIGDQPLKYHVTFFDSREVTRAWVPASRIRRYVADKPPRVNTTIPDTMRLRLNVAERQAQQATKEKDLLKRLRKWSFVARYKGEIKAPKPVEELMPFIRRFMRQNPDKM
uniref:Zinc finger CW-type PWWP domain protein 1 n=1 Tax=Cacopsylla melanoneura TaxID=428564 RepID=A0A8D8V8K2_9HEMI